MLVEKINSKDNFEREIILISVSDIEEFSLDELTELSKYFTLFVVNNKKVIIDKYFEKASELIKSGLAYFCTWGNECEKIHDIIDEEVVSLELKQTEDTDDENVIMTTWHKNESLKEALWFFLMNTSPTEKYYSECKNSLVLLIGNSVETDNIKFLLENQNLLENK